MTDQPVTPDREALIQAVLTHPYSATSDPVFNAGQMVDAVLPLLTDALDRARQECEQLRSLLRQIHMATASAGLPLGQGIHSLIDASGLLDPWDACAGGVEPTAGASSDRRRTEER